MNRHYLTDLEKTEIVTKFITGNYSYTMLAKEYKTSVCGIWALLKRRKAKAPEGSYFYNSKRKYPFNEHYFDTIDTEDKAYFLGLLYADGTNNEKRGLVAISLQEEDKEILEKFNVIVSSNRPLMIANRKRKPNHKLQYRLNLDSKIMSKKISELGCWANKTFTLKFPNDSQVPYYLLKHFIRGYFDGDGSISYWHEKATNALRISIDIVSTEQFCEGLQAYILKELGLPSRYKKRHKNRDTTTRQLKITGNKQALKFINWLYDGAIIYLARKFKKTEEIKLVYKCRMEKNC